LVRGGRIHMAASIFECDAAVASKGNWLRVDGHGVRMLERVGCSVDGAHR
jgi:hypothetical protein